MFPLSKISSSALGSLCAAVSLIVPSHLRSEQTFPPDQIEFFEKNVRPVLAENCYECHGAHKQKNGLRLDSRDAVLQGSEYKKVVIAGDPEGSLLIKAVRHVADVEPMPNKKPQLASNQIEALAQWIKMGLPWPKEAVAAGKPKWQEHWAFQPVKKPAVPEVRNQKSETGNPVDAFVAQKLSAAGLDFAPAADRAILCRRLYLTLHGLLPTFDETQAFVNDKSPDAVAHLVDHLLSSPHYGERWARHWLDVARYSDTDGYRAGGVDNRFPYAYTYRDWVVKSFNEDLPYDQFLMQQLAADKMLPEGKTDGSLAAMGFLTINDYFLGDHALQMDDRIDVVGRGMLGITIGCARCHDHKYDPIQSKDYYALYSVFNSSESPKELPIIGQPGNQQAVAEFNTKVAEARGKIQAFKQEVFEDFRNAERLREYLLFAQSSRDLSSADFAGSASKAKLRDRIAAKWRDFLKSHALTDKPNPVMIAWKEFAALPEKDFSTKAVEVAKRLSEPALGVNPVVRNELAKRPAPKSMSDVASLYADVFRTCVAGDEPDNADWKQLKQLLTAAKAPMSMTVERIDECFTRKDHEHMTQLENQIKKLEITEDGAPLRAMVMSDTPQPRDVRVFIRGNPARQGDPAPRAYLSFLGGQKFTQGSGRLELAKAIASKDNPLTARVIVNRVWMEHFGRPLVAQTSDFGVQSPKPEQAALLDYLAATFMEEGWSLKKLHRAILTSRTYQQTTLSTPEKNLKDPENGLLCRFNRQRLDYETMRDTVLQAAGALDVAKIGGRSVTLNAPDVDTRRTVYLFVDRYEQATIPAMFDFANPDQHSPQRFVTTVPQQTLFLMNSPFMRTQSEKLSAKLPVEGSAIDSQTIKTLYHKVLAREPKLKEVELAQRFINDAQTLQQPATHLWNYGTVRINTDPQTHQTNVTDFTEFTHFTQRGKGWSWAPGPKIPDPKWHYAFWGNEGGHAGADDVAPSARWVAPFDAVISISGDLIRPNKEGNGVHGWIHNSRSGVVLDAHAAPEQHLPMKVARHEVKKGDMLTFAVTSEGDDNSDSFTWAPVIHRLNGSSTELLTNAQHDFCGADHWPINRPRPQSVLAQLVQILMMSNEFQFVD